MSKIRRSAGSDLSELKESCPIEGCGRKFISKNGVSVHMNRAHGHQYDRSPKIPKGETSCFNCGKDFGTYRSLSIHGSPDVCKERMANSWKEFICQSPFCGIAYVKYMGKKRTKGGQKYCSPDCSSDANRGFLLTDVDLSCLGCGIKMKYKKGKKYCSKECVSKNPYKGYIVKDSSKMGGLREKGGKSIQFPYINRHGETMSLNREEIELAKVLDSTEYKWSRNTVGFPYLDTEGRGRNFHPDFYIEELDLFVEYKGWATEKMIHKMKDSLNRSNFNLKVVFGMSKRYRDMGTNIDEVKDDPSTLLTEWNIVCRF